MDKPQHPEHPLSPHLSLLLSGDNSQWFQLMIALTSKTQLSPQYLEAMGTRISRGYRI